MKQEIFTPWSSMTGVNLECPRSFMEDKRWEVPDFMKVLPIGVRANVIYRVHVFIG